MMAPRRRLCAHVATGRYGRGARHIVRLGVTSAVSVRVSALERREEVTQPLGWQRLVRGARIHALQRGGGRAHVHVHVHVHVHSRTSTDRQRVTASSSSSSTCVIVGVLRVPQRGAAWHAQHRSHHPGSVPARVPKSETAGLAGQGSGVTARAGAHSQQMQLATRECSGAFDVCFAPPWCIDEYTYVLFQLSSCVRPRVCFRVNGVVWRLTGVEYFVCLFVCCFSPLQASSVAHWHHTRNPPTPTPAEEGEATGDAKAAKHLLTETQTTPGNDSAGEGVSREHTGQKPCHTRSIYIQRVRQQNNDDGNGGMHACTRLHAHTHKSRLSTFRHLLPSFAPFPFPFPFPFTPSLSFTPWP